VLTSTLVFDSTRVSLAAFDHDRFEERQWGDRGGHALYEVNCRSPCPALRGSPCTWPGDVLDWEMPPAVIAEGIDAHPIMRGQLGVVRRQCAHDLCVTGPGGQHVLTFLRTRSLRHTRHRGSRWKPLRGASSTASTVLSAGTRTTWRSDIVSSPRSGEHARWVVDPTLSGKQPGGFIGSLWYFCGTSMDMPADHFAASTTALMVPSLAVQDVVELRAPLELAENSVVKMLRWLMIR
jgi:hypothetical protein